MFTFFLLPLDVYYTCDRCAAVYGLEWAKIASFKAISPFINRDFYFCLEHKTQMEIELLNPVIEHSEAIEFN